MSQLHARIIQERGQHCFVSPDLATAAGAADAAGAAGAAVAEKTEKCTYPEGTKANFDACQAWQKTEKRAELPPPLFFSSPKPRPIDVI